MQNFVKNNKFLAIILVLVLALYSWAQTSSFKLYKSEYGTKWAPNTVHGSVHHK